MLSQTNLTSEHQTFGYRFINSQLDLPVQIDSLGCQLQTSQSYYFDGCKRPAEEGNCIFQYTLSGNGMFESNGIRYPQTARKAFLAKLPENHRYYLPSSSDSWEFLFVTLKGELANKVWNDIILKSGSILTFTADHPFLDFLWEFYHDFCVTPNSLTSKQSTAASSFARQNNNVFDCSTAAYKFLIKLQTIQNTACSVDPISDADSPFLDASIRYMNEHLSENISLNDIAAHVDMSKYYFERIFQKQMGTSPWLYLTKLRIEHAARLLLSTNDTVGLIAQQCGYDSANYFNKVFRKYVGMSAGVFRKSYVGMTNFTINL